MFTVLTLLYKLCASKDRFYFTVRGCNCLLVTGISLHSLFPTTNRAADLFGPIWLYTLWLQLKFFAEIILFIPSLVGRWICRNKMKLSQTLLYYDRHH